MKRVLIFSAPSGSGKTTIVRRLLEQNPTLSFSVSATTRPKRGHEVDGQDYYFLTLEDFVERLEEGQFVEAEEVYEGTYYGTLKSEVHRIHAQGQIVVFDVDVVGGVNLKKYFGNQALSLFVKVPSMEELEKRLRQRGTESEADLQKRLAKSEKELSYEERFDVSVLNEDLELAVQKIQQLIEEVNN